MTGGADGHVRFFDFQFRILAWFEELTGGPVTSISFDRNEEFLKGLLTKSEDDIFAVPNFIVGTSSALILSVDSTSFEDPTSEVCVVCVCVCLFLQNRRLQEATQIGITSCD